MKRKEAEAKAVAVGKADKKEQAARDVLEVCGNRNAMDATELR